MRPIIFDDAALVALFAGQRRVYATWKRAEDKGYPLLVPAAAVFSANRQLWASEAAWDFVALTSNVVVLELTGPATLRASDHGNDLSVAQTSLEAAGTGNDHHLAAGSLRPLIEDLDILRRPTRVSTGSESKRAGADLAFSRPRLLENGLAAGTAAQALIIHAKPATPARSTAT